MERRALPRTARCALLVDGGAQAAPLLEPLCRGMGLALRVARDGAAGLAATHEVAPDLLLLDLDRPAGDGLALLTALRADPRLAAVPILALGSGRASSIKAAVFAAGADDYLAAPLRPGELDARLRAGLRSRELYERLAAVGAELETANARLSVMARTDALTGLFGPRAFGERLEEEFLRAERYRVPLTVGVGEAFGVAHVAEALGRATGDRLLALFAQRLAREARATDVLGRYGATEFAILLPHAGLGEARAFADRVVRRLTEDPVRLPGGAVAPVRLLLGLATHPDSGPFECGADLLEAADRALFETPRRGGPPAALALPDAHADMPRRRAAGIHVIDEMPGLLPPRGPGRCGSGA